ncbi:hypothetical protein [Sediminicola arcticus]|mgnify:CR=1 FL=1|jgi:hypothetical protein|uniref:Uncharacterized protein n=1 Tax=Sediminicola arcticus TaxID=1574308 RepID=A0ABV2SVK0_9FLAO
MKQIQTLMALGLFIGSFSAFAQNEEGNEEQKLSYYEQRAQQDATYEQELRTENEEEAEEFWEDQQAYEKDLKKRDKRAYKAYMKGKRDTYQEHACHCNHDHHSAHFYYYADYYYSSPRYYRSSPRRSTISTGVRVGAPRVRLGIGL